MRMTKDSPMRLRRMEPICPLLQFRLAAGGIYLRKCSVTARDLKAGKLNKQARIDFLGKGEQAGGAAKRETAKKLLRRCGIGTEDGLIQSIASAEIGAIITMLR